MIQNEIAQLLRPTIEDMGYLFWGCEFISQGHHSLLRLYIDKEGGGIGIDDCERVSRQVSALLDVDDPIQGHYRLEVSSPGLPRPLFYPWQYERVLGHVVQIKLIRPVDGKRKFIGPIIAVKEDGLILSIDGVEQNFLFSTIAKANLTDE